jgi:formylmethanofuran dehydrogenase subunit C
MSAMATGTVTVDADEFPRGLNLHLRQLASQGAREIVVLNPRSRHNLGVGQTADVTIRFCGSTGYYCGGLNSGTTILVEHNTGWAVGEAMARGRIEVAGNAVIGTGASMLGGTLVIRGNAGPRTGACMKGGVLIVEGSVGYLSGFMTHAGHLIVCGDAGDALADSLWQGNVWVAGRIRSLGNDAIVVEPTDEESVEVHDLLRQSGIDASLDFKKVVAERKLWYFDARDPEAWLKI